MPRVDLERMAMRDPVVRTRYERAVAEDLYERGETGMMTISPDAVLADAVANLRTRLMHEREVMLADIIGAGLGKRDAHAMYTVYLREAVIRGKRASELLCADLADPKVRDIRAIWRAKLSHTDKDREQ